MDSVSRKLLITFDNRYSIVKSKVRRASKHLIVDFMFSCTNQNVLYRFEITSDEDQLSKAQDFCKMNLQNAGRSASLSEFNEAYVAASADPLPPGAMVPV